MLKSMLSMLMGIATNPTDLSQQHGLPSLETEEESDSSEGSTTAVAEDTPDSQASIEEVYKAESTDADRLLAVHELLRRLKQIRNYVEGTWSKYIGRHLSLTHVTVATNAAIDCGQHLGNEFGTACPEGSAWGDLVDLLSPKVTAYWQKDLSALSSKNINEVDLIFRAPTALLKVSLGFCEGIVGDWDRA
ncbi:MAG: hypothetical protein Q9178_005323 [Gyalolechia marmorata]